MRRALSGAWLVVLLAAAVVARADDPKPKDPPAKAEPPKTAAEKYQAVMKELQAAQAELRKAYQEAKTDEDRQKVLKEKAPKTPEFAKRFLAIAKEHPTDSVAVDALVFAAGSGRGADAREALDALVKDHAKSEKVGQLCFRLAYNPDAEASLRRIIDQTQEMALKGAATHALGQALKNQSEQGNEAAGPEAEKLFEKVAETYAEVKVFGRELGKMAKGELNEIRHLSVGKVAPDIEAEDIDGVKFKLSDYRGKVVLLDFWGHW